MSKLFPFFTLLLYFTLACSGTDRAKEEKKADHQTSLQDQTTPEVWSVEKANAWSKEKGWLIGCNFSPSTAINQLEMWQEETFDPTTIDRELGWAEDLGFNSIRVYLHDLFWEQDSLGFLERMEEFLEISDRHQIGVMFVLFDGVWDPFPKTGTQPDPKPHVHNSGWAQSPGLEVLQDSTQDPRL